MAIEGKLEEGTAIADKILEENENDIEVLMSCGIMQQRKGDYDTARKLFERIIERVPNHAGAKFEAANCLIYEKEYILAKKSLMSLYKEFPTNPLIADKLKEVGQFISEIIEAKEAAGEADDHDLYELADCYEDMGRNEDSLAVLERIEIPFDCQIKASKMKTVLFLKLERYEEAIENTMNCQELIDRHPEEDRNEYLSKILYMRAGAYNCLGNRDAEYDTLEYILSEVDPDFAIASSALARWHYEKGYYKKALENAEQAIRSDESVFEGFFEAGRASYELGDSNSAIDYLVRARDMEPYHLSTHIYIIKSMMDQRRTQDAEEYIEYLVTNNAKSLDIEFLKGRLEVLKDNRDKAIEILKDVLEKSKQLSKIERMNEVSNMGEIYNLLANLTVIPDENFEETLALIEEGLEYESGFGPLLQMKGNILYDCGDFDGALAAYKEIAERYPQHLNIYWDMGCCYEMIGQLEESLKAYEEQTRRRPNGDSFGAYARVAMAMGNLDKAEAAINKAIEIDETNPVIYSNYARLLQSKGKQEEALEAYAKTRELGKTYDIRCRKAYRDAVNLHVVRQEGDEALAILKDCYEQYGEIDDLYEIHSVAQIFGKGELAMDNLKRLSNDAKIAEDSYEYQSKYAEILLLTGEAEKAASIFDGYCDTEPLACFYSGHIYYNLGNYEKALESF